MSTLAPVQDLEAALPVVSSAALAAMMKKPEAPAAEQKTTIEWPIFLKQANQEYQEANAHIFTLHGNVHDYPDNNAAFPSLRKLMVTAYDDNYSNEVQKLTGVGVTAVAGVRGQTKGVSREVPVRICATYVINEGLRFESLASKKLFQDMLSLEYSEEIKHRLVPPDFLSPQSFDSTRTTMGRWFELTKKRTDSNRVARVASQTLLPEANMTVIFFDTDIFLPSGKFSSSNTDRTSIGYFRQWAGDKQIGHRNKIFLITKNLTDIHESLRGGSSGVSSILVPKPSLEDRQAYSESFCANLAKRCKRQKLVGTPLMINNKEISGVSFAEGFDHRGVAIQSSGMSRNQIEKAFNESLHLSIPLDDRHIRIVKQKCVEEEYGGVLEFIHPVHSFDQVGGHDEIKKYILEEISGPLRSGDARLCSPGLLMVGPGGTGKTFLAKAAAHAAGVNFVELKLSKLLNKYVGGTEEQTEKMLEAIRAAAPCVAFMDEIEAALGGGRQTAGDSNTGGRLMQTILTFLSDESRLGQIVVIAATNRPDLIDPVVIRAGRFGAVLPVLPPPKEGEAGFQGRASILSSLASKHNVRFESALQGTMMDRNLGLGRLLLDSSQIWTGAEIEALLRDALGLALRAKRDKAVITMADWSIAMDSIIPTTGKVEDMTDLALFYTNNVRYCPLAWQDKMKAKATLGASLLARGYDVS